jgi:hypothetical protein
MSAHWVVLLPAMLFRATGCISVIAGATIEGRDHGPWNFGCVNFGALDTIALGRLY